MKKWLIILPILLLGFGVSILWVFKYKDTYKLPPDPFSPDQYERHRTFHYPVIKKKTIGAVPYLFLPFRASEVPNYQITESWIYSAEELAITNHDPIHAGVDFAVPYGTPVVSPVDGYAWASYHTFWVKDENKNQVYYQGKPIRMGLGYFVYMYSPKFNRFVEMAHLSAIDPAIPFSPPESYEEDWIPTSYRLKISEMPQNPKVVWLKRGVPIGRVGYSGLALDGVDYRGEQTPVPVDQNTVISWDEPHLHFEEFWIDQETEEKGWQRDPYAIYDTHEKYPVPGNPKPLGRDPLFLLDESGLPLFAT